MGKASVTSHRVAGSVVSEQIREGEKSTPSLADKDQVTKTSQAQKLGSAAREERFGAEEEQASRRQCRERTL